MVMKTVKMTLIFLYYMYIKTLELLLLAIFVFNTLVSPSQTIRT